MTIAANGPVSAVLAALAAVLPYAESRAEDLAELKEMGKEDAAYVGADEARSAVEAARRLVDSMPSPCACMARRDRHDQTAKHTAGPWIAEGWNGLVVNAANGVTIVLAPGGSANCSLAELQANALLIAAAPQMLAALLEAEDQLAAVESGSTGGIPNAIALQIPEALSDVRLAIAATKPRRKEPRHEPAACPSNHWNDGTDHCADCGAWLG